MPLSAGTASGSKADGHTGRAEFDLLCSIVRAKGEPAAFTTHPGEGIDYPVLLQLAFDHSVRPQLLVFLAAISWQGVPQAVRTSLESFRQGQLLRALSLSEELARVTGLLGDNGILVAAFKGAALSAYLYGDISRREYNDIDLIVPPDAMAAAEQILGSLGYRNRQGDRTFRQHFLRHQRQYALHRPGFDAAIDLHWGFSAAPLPFPLRPQEIWATLEYRQVGGHAVPTLSDDDLALQLAGHGTKEAWKCLCWVCDFARLLELKPQLDWKVLHRRACSLGSGDAVLLGCAMAAGLLDAPVPRALAPALAASCRVQRLAGWLIGRMRQGLAGVVGKRHLEDLELCDRRLDRLRAELVFALTPSPGDYRALPLPQGLWSLYYGTRPFRLAAKGLAAAFNRL